jgi:hypothetical protein
VILDSHRIVAGDLVYRELGLIVEYEGSHHQSDRNQYGIDIDRYADLRDSGLDYVQVTKEKAQHPKRMVREIHARMVARGYDGPPPTFGEHWKLLFLPLSVAAADPTVKFTAA